MRKRHEEHENHLRFLEELRKGKEMFMRKYQEPNNNKYYFPIGEA